MALREQRAAPHDCGGCPARSDGRMPVPVAVQLSAVIMRGTHSVASRVKTNDPVEHSAATSLHNGYLRISANACTWTYAARKLGRSD